MLAVSVFASATLFVSAGHAGIHLPRSNASTAAQRESPRLDERLTLKPS
jgi:hypothetical protein